MVEFVGIIHKESRSDYGVSFPDFPGCITAGKTLQEAYRLAREALQGHVDTLCAYNDPLPTRPMSLDKAYTSDEAQDALALFLVPVTLPGKQVRLNITMDERLVRTIDAFTNNRSAFLAEAARAHLQQMQ